MFYCGSNPKFEYNIGRLVIFSIIEFQNSNNKEIENINDNKNYIIAEFEIKEDNETIRIINSYEEFIIENDRDDYKEYHNEKEIKDNCEIRINNEIIPFSFKYKFNKKGKYTIKYIFKNNITKTTCLFGFCRSLVNINLSNYNTQKVTYMSGMFAGCSSLTNVNLSNFNTQNVISMNAMLAGCSSITNINLSNFNTQNIIDMGHMFEDCSSLTNINLSYFNTQKINDMQSMFNGCKCLKKGNIVAKDEAMLNQFNY